MIGRLRGTVVQRSGENILIEVGGVGYSVAVTPRTLSDLPRVGEEAVLHTHLHVREDQLSLFGFGTSADKDVFALLLGVSGIGPKVAMAILATLTYEQLCIAVASDDIPGLTAVPGIGKRSAQKLLLELKPKLNVADVIATTKGPMGEVRDALEGLGYEPEEISGALLELESDLSVEELLKQSLRLLGKARQ